MKTPWILLAVIVVGVLLFFSTRTPPAEITQNITNATQNITGATFGDLVTINFILELENGTAADTNNPALAEQYKITNYVKGPFAFVLGQSGKVPGFDEALIGMKEGEHRETMIEPSEKEIILNISRTKVLPRVIAINKMQAFPKDTFETEFKKPPIIGDVVFTEKFTFKYQVVNTTEKNVITKIVAKEGEEYKLENTEWTSRVVKIAENDIMFYQMPEENQTMQTQFGTAKINMTSSRIMVNFQPELNKIFNRSLDMGGGFSMPQLFQVTEIKDDYFMIKRYGALTDKRLKIKADMLTIVPGVKEVKQQESLITEVETGTEV